MIFHKNLRSRRFFVFSSIFFSSIYSNISLDGKDLALGQGDGMGKAEKGILSFFCFLSEGKRVAVSVGKGDVCTDFLGKGEGRQGKGT